MSKKFVLVAGAMALVVSAAPPAPAHAFWKHHSTSIQQNVQFGLTGNIKKQGGIGGIECQVTMRVNLASGETTAALETFIPHPTSDTTNCRGLGGLAFCQIHKVVPQAPNWAFHKNTTDVALTTTNITYETTGGFCVSKQLTATPASVTLTPNQPNTFSSFQATGSSSVHIQTTSGAVDQETMTIGGTLNVESPNAGTYSI